MSTLDHARKRVAAFIAEIDRLKQSEFPYAHPHDALDLLADRFRRHQSILEKASPTISPGVTNACSESLYELYIYLPILGFILRSTNVRNAFEAFHPFLRLARSILGNKTKLIVSSEWDFSPYVYRSMTHLPGFVLIGLPASESPNPLLLSLAGHELGHAIWAAENFTQKFEGTVKNRVLQEIKEERWDEYNALYPQFTVDELNSGNLNISATWMPAYTWALSQAEEMFCDFFGIRLFSESFLHAFAYLLSPGTSGQRPLIYPNIKRRVSHMVEAAKAMIVEVPTTFVSDFEPETEPLESTIKLLVSIADAVSASLATDLIELAKDFGNSKAVPTRDPTNVNKICEEFCQRIAPTSGAYALTDILNAGWECGLDNDLWKDVPQIKDNDRDRLLKDLILKSIEVSEIQYRIGNRHDP